MGKPRCQINYLMKTHPNKSPQVVTTPVASTKPAVSSAGATTLNANATYLRATSSLTLSQPPLVMTTHVRLQIKVVWSVGVATMWARLMSLLIFKYMALKMWAQVLISHVPLTQLNIWSVGVLIWMGRLMCRIMWVMTMWWQLLLEIVMLVQCNKLARLLVGARIMIKIILIWKIVVIKIN